MNKITEAIAEREALLGRKLTAGERYVFMAQSPNLDPDKDWPLVESETREGIALRAEYDKRLSSAKLSSGVSERHKLAHWFSAEKKSLIQQFKNGSIERIGPQQAA